MRVLDVSSFLPLSGTTVTLDAQAAAGDVLGDQLVRLGGAPIVIQNATRKVDGGIVTVTGTASLLQMADLPVTATAAWSRSPSVPESSGRQAPKPPASARPDRST